MSGERIGSPTKEQGHEQFTPAFETAPEKARPSPHPLHHSAERSRPMGKAALELDLASEVRGVDLDAVRELVDIPRRRHSPLKEEKLDRGVLFLPFVASAVAHRAGVEPAFIPPSIESIKESSVLIRIASDVIHFVSSIFSADWGGRFDEFVVKKAARRIKDIAGRVLRFTDSVAEIEKPKVEFLDELQAFYAHVQSEGADPTQNKNRVVNVARVVYGRRPFGAPKSGDAWYDPEQFPLVSKVLKNATTIMKDEAHDPILVRSEAFMTRAKLRLVTPEIMQGVHDFLQQHHRDVEPMPESSTKLPLTRRVAERYASRKLSEFPGKVTHILDRIYAALPQDGAHFADDVQGLSKKIVELTNRGYTSEDITSALRKDVLPVKPKTWY